MDTYQVTERRPGYSMIRWDGSAQAAEWITEHFGDAASFEGDGDDLTLKMWTTWEIPRGDFIVNRDDSFQYVPADQVNDYWQEAAPLIDVAQ